MVLKFSMQKEIQSFSSVMEKKEKLEMQYIGNRNKRGHQINKNRAIWYFRLSDMNEVNHHAVQIVMNDAIFGIDAVQIVMNDAIFGIDAGQIVMNDTIFGNDFIYLVKKKRSGEAK